MSQTVAAQFVHDFQAERLRWLRRRALWYCGVLSVIGTLGVLTDAFFGYPTLQTVGDAVGVALHVTAFFVVRRVAPQRQLLSRLVTGLIVISGGIAVLAVWLANPMGAGVPDEPPPGLISLGIILITHLTACLFLPWTVRESVRPLVPLLALNAVVVLVTAPLGLGLVVVALSPLIGVPGVLICWWRYSWFRRRFHFRALTGWYERVQQELTDARRIHESLFPPPLHDGPIRVDYVYQPMQQIGGDFLFLDAGKGRPDDGARVSLVLLDVTGHGIAAALTVNRLHGELERLFAEDPDIAPGQVLVALDRYVHLTLARHSIYATALCVRVGAADQRLEWASAGHPPALLCHPSGTIARLESTTLVLGVCSAGEFEPEAQSALLLPGARLIAYTDGAIEARDAQNRMVGIDGLEDLCRKAVSPARDGPCLRHVLGAIDQHRAGRPDDDTLLVEVAWADRRTQREPQMNADEHG